jgi:hypothetical protein
MHNLQFPTYATGAYKYWADIQSVKQNWYSMPAKANTVFSTYHFIIFKAQH